MATESGKKQHHFVLVHGACHGSWWLYKVATLLSLAGHRVTALDMDARGASPGRPEGVPSFEEYSRQLLAAVAGLPLDEEAVLAGWHSFGGLGLALAMEQFPERVAVAVFVMAFMPAAGKLMVFVFELVTKRKSEFPQEEHPVDRYMDSEFETSGDPSILCRQCDSGHSACGDPGNGDGEALTAVPRRQMKGNVLTAERYGAVRRVCVVAKDNATIPAAYQQQIVSWSREAGCRELIIWPCSLSQGSCLSFSWR